MAGETSVGEDEGILTNQTGKAEKESNATGDGAKREGNGEPAKTAMQTGGSLIRSG